MRSREAKGFVGALAGLGALFALGALLAVGPAAALFAGGCGGACALLGLGWCVRQGRRIDRLAGYLAGVYAGGEILDIRTQREGELSALRDDIYKLTTILSRQKEALAGEKQRLADFLGDVAHQLKTPLSAILLETELWQSPLVPAEEKEGCAERIAASARRTQWLASQLLKLCRLDAAAVRFEKKPWPCKAVMARALGALGPLFEERGVRLVQAGGEGSLECDGAWTAEALENLLKNAAQHTPPGGQVVLEARCTPLYAQFVVSNTGRPIPQKELPRLFERFWRGSDEPGGGAGIGLALAKAIARGQDAALWAENGPAGPRFVLRFPR